MGIIRGGRCWQVLCSAGAIGLALSVAMFSTRADAVCPGLILKEWVGAPKLGRLGKVFAVSRADRQPGRALLLVATSVTVNADGADKAYEASNHGWSYLCDGMCLASGCEGEPNKRACQDASKLFDRFRRDERRSELILECEDELSVFKRLKVFGFTASAKDGNNRIECGKTRIPYRASPDGLHFLQSTTLLSNADSTYLDATAIPFAVLPGGWPSRKIDPVHGMAMGDAVAVLRPTRSKRESVIAAVMGDLGPEKEFGEASIALHQYVRLGRLADPPPFQDVPGQRHPQLSAIPLPYWDSCDGDVRAKRSDSHVWWFLVAAGGDRLPRYDYDAQTRSGSIGDLNKRAFAPLGGAQCVMDAARVSAEVGSDADGHEVALPKRIVEVEMGAKNPDRKTCGAKS